MASRKARVDDAVSPQHYKRGSIEVYDFIEEVCRDLPGDEAVAVGNVIKYVSRYRTKSDGHAPSIHVRKAGWYLNRLLQAVEKKEGDRN